MAGAVWWPRSRRSIVLAGLAPAAAQDEAPPEPEAATTTGSAGARAIVTQVTPGVGSFPTGLAAGVALSNVTNSIAQAQAESLDLGLIGILIESFDLVNGFDVPDALFRRQPVGRRLGQPRGVPDRGVDARGRTHDRSHHEGCPVGHGHLHRAGCLQQRPRQH